MAARPLSASARLARSPAGRRGVSNLGFNSSRSLSAGGRGGAGGRGLTAS